MIAFIKPPYILMSKGSDYQSFFIVNSNKASRYHLCLKVDRCHPCSINGSTGKYHPRTTIERLCVSSKSW